MKATLIKILYIPWVLLLFVIAAILTLLELVLGIGEKYSIGSQ
jgi:hypothetical protein